MKLRSSLLFLAGVAGVSQLGFSENNSDTQKFYYATTPEGKTLPEGIARFRAVYQSASGQDAYDDKGKKSASIAKYSARGGAGVFEYGLSEKLSLQVKLPFYLNQKVSTNTSASAYKDLKASLYSSQTATLATATKVTITDQASLETAIQTAFVGGCVAAGGASATCATNYANGTLTSASATALGLSGSFGAGSASVPARTYAAAAASGAEAQISSGIDGGVESKGGSALGDMELGVLWEAFEMSDFFVSIGGGFRLPTGNRNLGVMELDTTRSAYELGLRLNLDYLPTKSFMVSWQNQTEVGILGTSRKVAGVTQKRQRVGAREVGFIYLKPSLASLSPSLDAIKTQFGVAYDYDSAEKIKTGDAAEITTDRSMQQNYYVGLGYSFLDMNVPLQIDLEYEKPFAGKNQALAADKMTVQLKSFAKF